MNHSGHTAAVPVAVSKIVSGLTAHFFPSKFCKQKRWTMELFLGTFSTKSAKIPVKPYVQDKEIVKNDALELHGIIEGNILL